MAPAELEDEELLALHEENEVLTLKLQKAEKTQSELDAELVSVRAELERSVEGERAKVFAANKSVSELQQALHDAETLANDFESDLTRTRGQLTEKTAELAAVEGEKQRAAVLAQDLETAHAEEIANLQKTLGRVRDKVAAAEKEVIALRLERTQLTARIDVLTEQVEQQRQQQQHKKNSEVLTLQDELLEQQNKAAALEAQIRCYQSEAEDWQRQQQQLSKYEEEVENLNSKNEKLQQETSKEKTAREEAESNLNTLRKENEAELANLKEQIRQGKRVLEERSTEIERLQQELVEADSALEKRDQLNRSDRSIAEQQRDEVQKSVAAEREKSQKLGEELRDTKRTAAEVSEERDQLEQEVKRWKETEEEKGRNNRETEEQLVQVQREAESLRVCGEDVVCYPLVVWEWNSWEQGARRV